MDYLDTPAALPLYEAQADIIMKNGYKKIVDVGARHGPVNDILYERGYIDDDYEYMGFDTSHQPIEYANLVWEEFDNIEYRTTTWENLNEIATTFAADCVIWSGVLLYRPMDHMELFERLQKFYNSNNAIIQEPCKDQPTELWLKNVRLNTIDDQLHMYRERYAEYTDEVLTLDVFAGKRVVAHVRMK